MTRATRLMLIAGVAVSAIGLANVAQSQNAMTFFVTSAGPGKGADLGGLEGADRHCQSLAQAAGASGKTWRAYLSTQASGGAKTLKPPDRIGGGPGEKAQRGGVGKDGGGLPRGKKIKKKKGP